MTAIWIVHREPRTRAALARLAAAPEDSLRAGPGDPALDAAPPADVVLLGLDGDFEAELEFAHRTAPRLGDATWILVPQHRDLPEAQRLFDTLGADFLSFPPDALALRQRIRAARERRSEALPLSQRPVREELRERFTRWFVDLELPELLRAVDPRLADVPLLVEGEPGSGRALLVRYVHAFGGSAAGGLVEIACGAELDAELLLARLGAGCERHPPAAPLSILLSDVHLLEAALQRQLAAWIEFGPPPGRLRSGGLRWIATVDDGAALDPRLRRRLARLWIRIPALRERIHAITRFANETAHRWCTRRGIPARRMGEDAALVLEEYPWPGNLAELEAVVEQTLVAGSADPVRAADLRLAGEAMAPLDAPKPAASAAAPPTTRLPGVLPELEAAPELWQLGDDEPGEEGMETELAAADELPDLAELLPEEPEEPDEPALEESGPEVAEPPLQRLAGALAHEVRNPLTAIRSFAALLPERYADSEFRSQFAELVGEGVERIEDVVAGLERLGSLSPPVSSPVDVTALLDELLRERRDTIRRRGLLVLKELESEQPLALADPDQLRFAFEAVLNQALELVPERGDVYCASRHHPDGLRGGPSLRVLLRFRGSPAVTDDAGGGLSPAENALQLVIADCVIRGLGGSTALDAGSSETVLVVDLPAPAL